MRTLIAVALIAAALGVAPPPPALGQAPIDTPDDIEKRDCNPGYVAVHVPGFGWTCKQQFIDHLADTNGDGVITDTEGANYNKAACFEGDKSDSAIDGSNHNGSSLTKCSTIRATTSNPVPSPSTYNLSGPAENPTECDGTIRDGECEPYPWYEEPSAEEDATDEANEVEEITDPENPDRNTPTPTSTRNPIIWRHNRGQTGALGCLDGENETEYATVNPQTHTIVHAFRLINTNDVLVWYACVVAK
ncbi:MAG: hypothetical protein OXF75_04195 [Acidimicrobiaceae bacterium]|nr:hypothetical protein [Acidimicrobiaceae bacterium]